MMLNTVEILYPFWSCSSLERSMVLFFFPVAQKYSDWYINVYNSGLFGLPVSYIVLLMAALHYTTRLPRAFFFLGAHTVCE